MYECIPGVLYEKFRDGEQLFEIKKHPVKNYYPHFHYATEICFVKSGQFEAVINGERVSVGAGDILFINPGELHQYIETGECDVVIAIISEIYSSDFVTEFGQVSFDHVLRTKEVNAKIYTLMEEFYETQSQNYFLENKIFADKLYSFLIRNYQFKERDTSTKLLNKILDYIYEKYKEDLTIENVARHFSYSKVTISKLFQQKVRVDFRVFVNDVRADMVRRMMNDPRYADWQLLQLVEECGFNSVATFYRSYKRRYGELPTAERAKLISSGTAKEM